MTELYELTAHEAQASLSKRQVSARELTQAVLDRIEAVDSRVCAYLSVTGELALEQLFFQRPAPHYSDYRSPIHGLYQCGASTHPGGGVSGIPGHNAAREILKDWKRLQRH